MKKYLFVGVLFILSCKEYATIEILGDDYETTFVGLMKEAMDNSHNNTNGILVSVKCDNKALNWEGALGFDSRDQTNQLALDQPFRIASITKTFVAVAILRLHELDSISINDPLSKWISDKHQEILGSEYDLNNMTILHCLNHTSGLYDYAMGGSPYAKFIKENPKRRWTRTEQLKFAIEHGEKIGYPGERYAYSDTGYILLGEIIEHFYNGDLGKGIRELIGFEKLEIKNTWLESLEPRRSTLNPVHRYFQGLDATEFDPSIDLYGGGGLMSTIGDLNIFMNALFNNKIFEDSATLELMLSKPNYDANYDTFSDRRYKDYRQGLWKVTINNQDVFMHSGLWGTHILHQLDSNTTVVVNFTNGGSDRLIKKLFMALNGYKN